MFRIFNAGLMVAAACLLVPAAVHADQQKDCQAKLLRGEAIGLVKGYGKKDGKLAMTVNEKVYGEMQFDAKLGLAKTFECALVKPGEALATAVFVSDKTNKVLATWYLGDLTVE
jgi:hypothetical protein